MPSETKQAWDAGMLGMRVLALLLLINGSLFAVIGVVGLVNTPPGSPGSMSNTILVLAIWSVLLGVGLYLAAPRIADRVIARRGLKKADD